MAYSTSLERRSAYAEGYGPFMCFYVRQWKDSITLTETQVKVAAPGANAQAPLLLGSHLQVC